MGEDSWEQWKNFVLDKIECIEKNVNQLTNLLISDFKDRERILTEHELKLKIITTITTIIFTALVGVLIKVFLKG